MPSQSPPQPSPPRYAILLYPAANRVYAESSRQLLQAELGVFSEKVLSTPILDVREEILGGAPYLTFRTAERLSDPDIAAISNLSTLYALFEIDGEGTAPPALRPVLITKLDKLDSDLLTVQKYPGKTNELFTKMLLNVTLLSTDRPAAMLDSRVHVLDPLCGRGTTLNQAMMYGFDATGLDVDGKDFEAYQHFIKTWLRAKRIKHTAESGALRLNKARLGNRLLIHFGLTKEQYKNGDARTLQYFNCDTKNVAELVKPGSVDVIVTDAPYGVQHGSHVGQKDKGTHALSRSPRDLLENSIPLWTQSLRLGGAMGISWNTHVMPRAELAAVLANNGLSIQKSEPFAEFEHRVDQSIQRDLIVARKSAR
jgi:hypothetical protein